MACPSNYSSVRNIGKPFCSGSCGSTRLLQWQLREYTYSDGSTCRYEEYQQCC
ncbi:hypothetical protein P9Z84_25845 [Bacillus cereus]|uniref:hypothetical protein n=1 Tax=Bacillus cereus TaxID=1396 RepID=UPI0015952F30|nr:hypothetical protein [Bacillus cereus]MEC3196093.1 hypothetical protein [Bacillus cereus]